MPAFARPESDISRGSWTTHSGGASNLWSTIDEEAADDNDYVISAIGANSTYEAKLSSVAPAVIPRAHTIFLRGRKDQANGNTKGITVALVQGATVLGSTDFPNLPATVAQQSIDLPRSMASLITDYADLRIRLTSTGITSGGASRRRAIVTGIALRVPSASDLVDDLLTRWNIAVTTTEPGSVIVSWNSGQFTGQGSTLARSVLDLYEQMQQAGFGGAERDRRYDIARGLWKVIEYERIRAEIVAGTYNLPPHQNQAEGIAICDTKIATFIASARVADAAEPV